jgi:hypothetical protein
MLDLIVPCLLSISRNFENRHGGSKNTQTFKIQFQTKVEIFLQSLT